MQVTAINPPEPVTKISPQNRPAFRWTYVILPVSLLLISLLLTAFFYRLLPAEIAYRFQGDLPVKWMGRSAIILWMNLPHFVFILLSIAVVKLVLLGSRYVSAEETPISQFLPVMGNMVALPQVILLFVMLSFFLYNAYQVRLIPVWIIVVIVMILGGIILGIFFVRAFRRSRRR
jgi:uncharacterized membrane protein